MRRRTLLLSDQQRRELVSLRDHEPRAYLREQAAALLKVADGASVHAVAQGGLHRPRHPSTVYRLPSTVYRWLNAYLRGGVAALVQRPRGHRGFSPAAGRGALPGAPPDA